MCKVISQWHVSHWRKREMGRERKREMLNERKDGFKKKECTKTMRKMCHQVPGNALPSDPTFANFDMFRRK